MGKGQTGLKAALGLVIAIGGFGTIGVQPAVAAPSAGCAAANAGTFDLSIPVGNPLQFGGSVSQTFAAGDVITATTTGVPTGTQAFFSPGSLSIVNAAFADVTGSATIPSAGTFTLTRTLSANVLNGGTLTFTCTPGPMVGGGNGATPNADEQANTATNATTTAVIVEDRVVGGILDDIITTNPEPQGPPKLSAEEEKELLREHEKLEIEVADINAEIDEKREYRGLIVELFLRDQNLIDAVEANEVKSNPEARRESMDAGQIQGAIAGLLPIDVGATRLRHARENIATAPKDIATLDQEIAAMEERIAEIRSQQEALTRRLGSTSTSTSTPSIELPRNSEQFDLDDLGNGSEGESILFVGRDPFARALMRYRGFKLDVADTSEGFDDSVKPLSFSRTLSSTVVGWVRAVYTDYEQDDASQQEGDTILVALGAHKDFSEELRLGLMATATWGDVASPVNNLDIDTTGYSLGAYGRYKWGAIDVNASTRIGLTDNDIAVSGTTGSYDTRLASATLGISGQEQLADNVWMRPAISVTGTWVNREDYQNSAGTNIGGNTTWSGNVTAGPTVGTSLTPPSGFKRLEPAIGLQATYTFSDQDTQAGTVATSEDDYLSLSLSPQLSMEFNNGASVDVFGSYFGIGADLDGWSVGGTLSIPLN